MGVNDGKWLKKRDQEPKGGGGAEKYEAGAVNCIKAPNGVHSVRVICGNVFIHVKHGWSQEHFIFTVQGQQTMCQFAKSLGSSLMVSDLKSTMNQNGPHLLS